MSALTVVSHGLAAASFVAVAGLLATRWRDRMRGSLLAVAAVVTVAWAVVLASAEPEGPYLAPFLADVAKGLAWILFLQRAFAGTALRQFTGWLGRGPYVVAGLGVAAAAWAAATGTPALGFLTLERTYAITGGALAILGLVLVEQAFRNTRAAQAWEAKFLWLGVGALFAYDVALYSTSYVLGGIEPTLYMARGFAVALTAPLLATGIARIKDFSPQLLMSQRLAFYTTSIVVAGVYLVLVSFAGYYVRVFGGTWGGALQVVLVFGALLGFATVLFSDAARARLRVFLAKNFFPYKYDYRAEWLNLTAELTRGEDGSSLAERTVRAFARLVKASGGSLWVARDGQLVPERGGFFSIAGITEPTDGDFCRFLEENEWIVDLDRARGRLGRDAQVPVPAWLAELPEAWLAIPLLHEGRLASLVVLRRPLARQQLTWEDLDLLRTAGRQAASYFALEQAGDALARERQFAALNRFTAFLMHDLSNIVAQQRLIVENAAKHKNNPEFVEDAISTIDNTVRRTARLLEQLKAGGEGQSTPRRTRLADVCRDAATRLSDREPRPELEVEDESAATLVAGDRLEHVLEHVIRNAQDATPAHGTVRIRVRSEGDRAVIEVADTGKGMDPEFVRDRLFRPFDTTKGAKGMGIGAFQTREFVRAAGGDVSVTSVPGRGTSFVIRLPRVA